MQPQVKPEAGEAGFGEWPHVCAILKLETVSTGVSEVLVNAMSPPDAAPEALPVRSFPHR